MKSLKHAILSAAIAAAIGVPAVSFASTTNASAPATQMSAAAHKEKSAAHVTQKKTKKKKSAKTAAVKPSGSALKSPVNAAPKG